MLSTGFLGSAYWSVLQPPTPYPCPFGTPSAVLRLNLVSLVLGHDGSDTSLLALFMGSCLKGFLVRLPGYLLFPLRHCGSCYFLQ
jgi:hypothetical protein